MLCRSYLLDPTTKTYSPGEPIMPHVIRNNVKKKTSQFKVSVTNACKTANIKMSGRQNLAYFYRVVKTTSHRLLLSAFTDVRMIDGTRLFTHGDQVRSIAAT
jgi:hypothetical protein